MKSFGAAQDYVNLVNQPGFSDALADRFSEMANRPALNGKQRISNAFFGGAAAGLKGYNNQQRQAKLADLDQMYKQVAETDAKLKFEAGQFETNKFQLANFVNAQYPNLLSYNKAVKKGDGIEANKIMTLIATDASRDLLGFKERFGDFDHVYNGTVFFNKNGESRGYGQRELFSQLPLEEVLGDRARELPLLLTNYTNQKFQQSDLLGNINVEQKQADLSKTQAQTGLTQAQTRNIDTDIRKSELALENPQANLSPAQIKANNELSKFNRDVIRNDVMPKLGSNKKLLEVYDALGQILEDSPNIVGNDYKTRFYKTMAEKLGLEPNIDYANLKSVEFEKMLRPILGAAFGQSEGERTLSKFPSISTNPVALKEYLAEEIPKVAEAIIEGESVINAYNENSAVNVYDPKVLGDIKQKTQDYLSERQNRKKNQKSNNPEIQKNNEQFDILGGVWDKK